MTRFSRHKTREQAMTCVYQYMVFERDIDELINDNFTEAQKEDVYMVDVVRTALANKDRFISYINEVLKDWTFERLGFVEQALLLNGCAEFELRQEQAAVIINEYTELAKRFAEPDSYKIVNGVLDII